MNYNIIIIGGGPAGMMTAGRAGELGQQVLLLEKNQSLGIKLLATGHGRCNLTNMFADKKELIDCYGKNSKFLMSAFHRFGVKETLDFFKTRGVVTKVEDNGRVFPKSDKARDVLQVLTNYLDENKVQIKYGAIVKKIIKKDDKIEKIILESGEELMADKFVICVGGQSYPGTGSTGDAYAWLEKLGHNIVKPRPALTSLILNDTFVKAVEGVSLQNIGITLKKDNKKMNTKSGSIIFTADGVSGPAIIDMSREVDLSVSGKFSLSLDLLPHVNEADLDLQLQKEFQRDGNKMIKNSLTPLAPSRLGVLLLWLLNIDPEKQLSVMTKDERRGIVRLLKSFSLEIKDVKGFDKAMITAGGVDTREVNPKTMQSKIIENLYFAGEILDLDGPTGGYNLQICWSTGHAAGEALAE
ncbi:NAD(P)/FAD-dependent oxidoreductase [Candidatus Parcubacteria bacterium]|nr:NAD(P)/FAD-dependent oxidoreductase [Patescibacteria group bacterium]MBU4309569.1 NAD(P)/FAD-dependent oxidoreductase [Patescibacteria group bacterium]MBU4578043.1 NAD(P)/FAD-dependent oxidoreductase [Patescibacteria group bacterium]MCG2696449.1 NAD(P)/FAD-dependent oxidoreductase [Candidatus Parcubacteria bacterium]